MKFPDIHCSELSNLKRILSKLGFKREALCRSEVLRMRHKTLGVAIAWEKRHTPFRKVNLVAYQVYKENTRAGKAA